MKEDEIFLNPTCFEKIMDELIAVKTTEIKMPIGSMKIITSQLIPKDMLIIGNKVFVLKDGQFVESKFKIPTLCDLEVREE